MFLEGAAGTGKKEVMHRLNKMGYETLVHPLMPFLLEVKLLNCPFVENLPLDMPQKHSVGSQ